MSKNRCLPLNKNLSNRTIGVSVIENFRESSCSAAKMTGCNGSARVVPLRLTSRHSEG